MVVCLLVIHTHTLTMIQRVKLLENTDRIQRTSDRLDEGYRIARETEEIGLGIMDNLQRDRETIQRMRGRVRETVSNGVMNNSLVYFVHVFMYIFTIFVH